MLLEAARPERIGQRLRLLRSIARESQKKYATDAGIDISAWSHYEAGRRRISVEAALRIVGRYHATLDYIYWGQTDGLPGSLRRAIQANMSHNDNPDVDD